MALGISPDSGFLTTRWWLSIQKTGIAPTQGRYSEEGGDRDGVRETLLGEVLRSQGLR